MGFANLPEEWKSIQENEGEFIFNKKSNLILILKNKIGKKKHILFMTWLEIITTITTIIIILLST